MGTGDVFSNRSVPMEREGGKTNKRNWWYVYIFTYIYEPVEFFMLMMVRKQLQKGSVLNYWDVECKGNVSLS